MIFNYFQKIFLIFVYRHKGATAEIWNFVSTINVIKGCGFFLPRIGAKWPKCANEDRTTDNYRMTTCKIALERFNTQVFGKKNSTFLQLFFAIFSLRFSAGMVWSVMDLEFLYLGWDFFLDFSKNWSFSKRVRESAFYHLTL